ncbi:hypothetical protein GPECTOR_197g344 [Gonium pectorale]|uniref:SRCR domain-containing protein n=1 Tax=Gonium pectorale TaxID=33097 RepID=A0A150FYL3_GONPE|nr:hypothetical protein GPECTOR_197g344 [Gonium pectorale]|eukprot:KXZ42140.1 hypothetical protein GPECTOR_197g344 [Gonium pectorale]
MHTATTEESGPAKAHRARHLGAGLFADFPSLFGDGIIGDSDGPKPPFQLRLAGGGVQSFSSWSGWLQASVDNGSTWGGACFKQWGVAEATVACRQLALGVLGLPRSSLFPDFLQLVPPAPASQLGTLLNIQNCRGDEVSLMDCARLPWGHQPCNSDSGAAGVICLGFINITTGSYAFAVPFAFALAEPNTIATVTITVAVTVAVADP